VPPASTNGSDRDVMATGTTGALPSVRPCLRRPGRPLISEAPSLVCASQLSHVVGIGSSHDRPVSEADDWKPVSAGGHGTRPSWSRLCQGRTLSGSTTSAVS
jgi:hypothetical protein